MRYSIYPYKPANQKILLLLAFLISSWQATLAQSISGPTCVVAGTQYQYNFSGSFTQSTFFQWSISGGSFVGASSGTPKPNVQVIWTSGTGRSISVFTTNPSANASLNVTVSTALQPGTISNTSQTVNGSTTPATINCSAASGGTCNTPVYTYLWQSSPNNVTFTSMGITTQNLSFSGPLQQTTYFKRAVTETGSGATGFSNVATVTVNTPFTAGSITPSTQTINYNQNASILTLTGVAGGANGYSYQWQSSNNGSTWTNVGTNATTYTPTGLTSPIYYYHVIVTSNGSTLTSTQATVNVNPQVFPGVVTPTSINIPSGTSPGLLTSTAASGGNCSGNYTYQWQSSTNGTTFTNISGATSLTYTPGNLSATTYYRRTITCGTDIQNTNICKVTVGTGNINLNFIRAREITKPGIMDSATAVALTDPNDVKQTTQYFDGLGRPVQMVARQVTPMGKDMISPIVYDEYGREVIKYLSYPSTSNDGNYKTFALQEEYNFGVSQFPGEQYYRLQTDYESSALNRVVKSYAAGLNWVGSGRGITSQYQVNTVSDSVQIWNISVTIGSKPVSAGRYAEGLLTKTITTDEQNHQVVEYKDKQGLTILKKVQLSNVPGTAHVGWLCTYYVYDDLNTLRFVIQPKAVELINSNWTITQSIADELCFRYEYDQRNRLIIKKVPGAGEAWMVYDARDRLVMAQDSIQRAAGKWVANEYDSLNRVWRVTLLTNSNNRAYHQNLAYNSTNYPSTTGAELVKQLFYDDYTWRFLPLTATMDNSAILNSAYFYTTYNTFPAYALKPDANYQTKGMLTGQKIEMLLTGAGSNYASSIFFYDDHGRLLQRQTTNFSNGKDQVTNQYDFSGKLLRSLLAQQKSGINAQGHTLSTKMAYDSAERLRAITKNIDNAPNDQTIVTNSYNELGQLRKKVLGNNIDSLVYEYNIRGWLTTINKSYISDSTKSNYFGLELGYDKQISVAAGGNYPIANLQYNGNIAGMVWRSGGDGVGRKYDFAYDNVNRLSGADFNQQIGSAFNKSAGINFSVGNLSYDANGNILTMSQKGWKAGSSSTIDSLQYNYFTGSNRLQNIIDKVNDTATRLADFRSSKAYMTALGNNKTSAATDYSYDGNGNLISDKNKDINSSITYHVFNSMPKIIPVLGKGTIKYAYDADGNKIAKQTIDSTGGTVKTNLTLYLEGFEYLNDTLQSLFHEEGRIRRAFHRYSNGTTGYAFEYDFFEKDHLGNIRTVLTQQKDTASYIATMEAAYRNTEKQLFGNITNTSYSRAAVPGPYPTDNTTSPNDSVARVNGGGQKLGPYIILKVMAGDSIKIAARSYYNNQTWTVNNPSFTDALNSLADGIVNMTAGAKGSMTDLTANGSPVYNALTSFMAGNNPTPPTNKPKAYLNWVLLDEQLKYVSGQSSAKAVGDFPAGTLGTPGTTMRITKSGYLYIFVNNETQGWDVFFDNLSVEHKTGPLIEETHYYPFGLTMAGISSKALKPNYYENKEKYNDGTELASKEFADGSGLEIYETAFRGYDPQTGRFNQIDPLTDIAEDFSPYSYALDNPISYNDPWGLEVEATNDDIDETGTKDRRRKDNDDKKVQTLPEVIVTAKKKDCVTCKTHSISAGPAPSTVAAPIKGKSNASSSAFSISIGLLGSGEVGSGISISTLGTGATGFASTIPPVLAVGGLIYSAIPYNPNTFLDWTKIPKGDISSYGLKPTTFVLSPTTTAQQQPWGEQYTLRARADGVYPVYQWGKGIVEHKKLNRGDIWKIGTTINGTSRYSESFYNNTGAGLLYIPEFVGPVEQLIFVERMKLLNYAIQHGGALPPGNTKLQ